MLALQHPLCDNTPHSPLPSVEYPMDESMDIVNNGHHHGNGLHAPMKSSTANEKFS